MSYDIDVVITRVLHSDNYTSNVGGMYKQAFEKSLSKLSDRTKLMVGNKDWHDSIQLEQPYSLEVLKRNTRRTKIKFRRIQKTKPIKWLG